MLALDVDAQANGRFPTAGFLVVGPGPSCALTVLRTTFGIVVSSDHGHDWTWVCEGAYDSVGSYDPPLALGSDGTIIVGLPGDGTATGVMESTTLCDWAHPTGDPGNQVQDIAWDASGTTIVLGVADFDAVTLTESDGISVSTDGGHTFVAGASIPNFYLQTVEVAPSQPRTLYVSGYTARGVAQLLRSDDGGMTLNVVTTDFTDPGVTGVFVSGVDPTNPNTVYVRANDGLGTRLIRSTDGGMSFTELTHTNNLMTGFALSDDGQTVWAGSADRSEGITRSVGGGPFVRVRANTEVDCLRFHGGLLYVCGDDGIDGYALAWSADGGDTFEPLMSVRDVLGPVPSCMTGTAVHDVCGAAWPAQEAILRDLDAATEVSHTFYDACVGVVPREPYGYVADAGTPRMDAAVPATDTGVRAMDAVVVDVPPSPPGERPTASGCGCLIESPTTDRFATKFAVALALWGIRRRAGRRV